jgi:DNA-binding NarL/FixJ family response regulator
LAEHCPWPPATYLSSVTPTVRVLIVDDHAAARLGLRLRLAREPDLKIVGEGRDAGEGSQLARSLLPDVVLVDLSLPDVDGIDLVHQLRQQVPGSACVVLSMHDSAANRRRAVAAGVAGFVGKQEPTDVLLSTIRAAAASA